MKNPNWIQLLNALKFYSRMIFFLFGFMILFKHYIYHEDITHAVIGDTLGFSLIMGVLFTYFFRSNWYNRKDDVQLFNHHDLNDS